MKMAIYRWIINILKHLYFSSCRTIHLAHFKKKRIDRFYSLKWLCGFHSEIFSNENQFDLSALRATLWLTFFFYSLTNSLSNKYDEVPTQSKGISNLWLKIEIIQTEERQSNNDFYSDTCAVKCETLFNRSNRTCIVVVFVAVVFALSNRMVSMCGYYFVSTKQIKWFIDFEKRLETCQIKTNWFEIFSRLSNNHNPTHNTIGSIIRI